MARCRFCKQPYKPTRPLQPCCDSFECKSVFVAEHVKKARAKRQKEERQAEKEARKAIRQAKEKLKTRSQWMKEAQIAFNAYRREMLKDEPCISCGRYHDGQYHAGHYMSVGAHPELRFEELNVWKQCQPCNTHLSGNLINYRKALIERIGKEKVDWLESDHGPKKYSIDELIAIAKEYKIKLAKLKEQVNEY